MRVASTLTDGDSPCDGLTAEQVCLHYAHRVYQFALMVCRDATEAEDPAQDALVRAINRLDQFDPERGNLETWLWRIVTNVARDAGRVKRRQRALLQRLFLAQPSELTEPDVSLQIADEDLLAAIRQLDSRPRAVIALRFGADLDYAAVGEALGLSPAAAKMATRRALATLRRLLEVQEDKKS